VSSLSAEPSLPLLFPHTHSRSPPADIQAKGDDALLAKYSLKANDAVLATPEQLPIFDDLLSNHSAKLIAGGAAQNSARGAQYILPANSVVYVGCVGDDKYAETLRRACAEAGLRVEYAVDAALPTGRCAAVITGNDRSLCTDLAAANAYTVDHLKRDDVWKLVEGAEVYYVGGYHFTGGLGVNGGERKKQEAWHSLPGQHHL
jgi:adenosine kinase